MNVIAPYDMDSDDGYREGSRWPYILLGGLIALVLVLGASFVWIKNQIDPSGSPGEPVQVRVEPGMSINEIGELLEEKDIITSATVWKWYVKLNGADPVEAGDYTIRKNESMGNALKVLNGGAVSTKERVVLTIPEGLRIEEIAAKVGELPGKSAERFLEIAKGGVVRSQYSPPGNNNLEGLMLPETYYFDEEDDEAAILQRMVETFDKTASSLNVSTAAERFKLTPYQVIVAASLIEREARVPEDRAPIARVIYNRLAVPMRLQIDATVLYALGQHKDTVLFADLEVNHPYNTYKIDGLPAGPIASPGRAAIEAAVSPATGTWLYYVLSESNGKHAFATTLDEFNRLVADARRRGVS
ncbi:MAG: endolytic transglycosylase MltG [Acidimicrobiales bacterium]